MMKLSRLLPSRHQLSEMLLYGKPDVKDILWRLHGCTSHANIYTATNNYAAKGHTGDRIFAPYTVYKGKAALSLTPVLPTFTKLDSGSVVLDRRGVVMMRFWPSIGERKYDWEKRQLFALSATEVGSLISLGPRDSCEFFHDPSMLSSNAGQVRKSLSIKSHQDGSGYFVSLNVVNNISKTKEYFTVPVTTAEFAVMKTACNFALPHIMGWDKLTREMPGAMPGRLSKVDTQVLDSEWDK
ncbi:Single-stranded DNA-binding protein WHY2, mitochondrial [Quillaja saponaria]|uniref:Single-stranded DNA-binding protein WHY2, mitochondrial n=1 Tax=Quillaja saponaria TaxID=32244 RepID=A0AAD7VFD0_QUISA|nr:Single-stranded DNA-binding protein WHY2, mitochondrial [Quillaja saponaria]